MPIEEPFGPFHGQQPTVDSKLEKDLQKKLRVRRYRASQDVPVPIQDLSNYDREDFQFMVEQDAESDLFKSAPFTGTQSDFSGKTIEQTSDMLREGADAVALAPEKEKDDARNWFMRAVIASGKAVASMPGISQGIQGAAWAAGTRAGQGTLAALDTLGTIAPSTVLGLIQGFIPGEQQYERLLREKREQYGLSAPVNSRFGVSNLPFAGSVQFLVDAFEEPGDLKLDFWNMSNMKAQREAWHATDAPWGLKFAAEVLMDPLNFVPPAWFVKGGRLAAKPAMPVLRPAAKVAAPVTKPVARLIKSTNPLRKAQLQGYTEFMDEYSLSDPNDLYQMGRVMMADARHTKNPVKRLFMESKARHMLDAVEGYWEESFNASTARSKLTPVPWDDLTRWLEPDDRIYQNASFPRVRAPDGSYYQSNPWDRNLPGALRERIPAGGWSLIRRVFTTDPDTGALQEVMNPISPGFWNADGELVPTQIRSEIRGEAPPPTGDQSDIDRINISRQRADEETSPSYIPNVASPVPSWARSAADPDPATAPRADESVEELDSFIGDDLSTTGDIDDAMPAGKGTEYEMESIWEGGGRGGLTDEELIFEGTWGDQDILGGLGEDLVWDDTSKSVQDLITRGVDEDEIDIVDDWGMGGLVNDLTPENIYAAGANLSNLSDRINYTVYVLTGMRGRDLGRIFMKDLLTRDFLKDPSKTFGEGTLADAPAVRMTKADGSTTYRRLTPRAARFIQQWAFGPRGVTETKVIQDSRGVRKEVEIWKTMPNRDQMLERRMATSKGRRAVRHPSPDDPLKSDALFFDSNWNEINYGAKGDSGYVQGLNERIGISAARQGVEFTRGTLRDYFATQSLLDGIDPYSIQMYMGHKPRANLSTLTHYWQLKASIQMAREGKHLLSPTDERFVEKVRGLLDGTIGDEFGLLDEMPDNSILPTGERPRLQKDELKERWNAYLRELVTMMHSQELRPSRGVNSKWSSTKPLVSQRLQDKNKAREKLLKASKARSKSDPTQKPIKKGGQEYAAHPDDYNALGKLDAEIRELSEQYRVFEESTISWIPGKGDDVPSADDILVGLADDNPSRRIWEKWVLLRVNESIRQRMGIRTDTKFATTGLESVWEKVNAIEGKLLDWKESRAPKEIYEFLESDTAAVRGGNLPETRRVGYRVTKDHPIHGGAEWSPAMKKIYLDMWEAAEGLTAVEAYFHRADLLGRVRLTGADRRLWDNQEWNIYKKLNNDAKNKQLLHGTNLYHEVSARVSALEQRLKDYAKRDNLNYDPDIGVPEKIIVMKDQLVQRRNMVLQAQENVQGIADRAGTTSAKQIQKMISDTLEDMVNRQDIIGLGLRQIARNPDGSIEPQYVVAGIEADMSTGVKLHEPYILVDAIERTTATGRTEVEYVLRKIETQKADGSQYHLQRLFYAKPQQRVLAYSEDIVEGRNIPGAEIRVRGWADDAVKGWYSLGQVDSRRVKHPEIPGQKVWNATKIAHHLFHNWIKIPKVSRKLTDYYWDRTVLTEGFTVGPINPETGLPNNVGQLTSRINRLLRVEGRRMRQRGMWAFFTKIPTNSRGMPVGEPFIVPRPELGKDKWGFSKAVESAFSEVYDQELNRRKRQLAAAAGGRGRPPGGRPPLGRGGDLGPEDIPERPWKEDLWSNKNDGKGADGNPRSRVPDDLIVDAPEVGSYGTQFRNPAWRRATVNRFWKIFRVPSEWALGQNVARTIMGTLLGSHRAARSYATTQGDAVMEYFRDWQRQFDYSSRYGRARALELVDPTDPESVPFQAQIFLAKEKRTALGIVPEFEVPAWLAPPAGSGVSAVEWEMTRMSTFLEIPEHLLTKYYVLKEGQLEFYQEYHHAIAKLQDMTRRAKDAYGEAGTFDIEDFVKGMMEEYYVPRVVNMKNKAARDASLEKTPVLGTNPTFFDERAYPTMAHGEMALGVDAYIQDPIDNLKKLTIGLFEFVADRQLISEVTSDSRLGRSLSNMSKPVEAGFQLLRAIDDHTMINLDWAIAADAHFPDIVDRINRLNRARAGLETHMKVSIDKEVQLLKDSIRTTQSKLAKQFLAAKGLRNIRGLEAFTISNEELAKLSFHPEAMQEFKVYVQNMAEHSSMKGLLRGPAMWSSMVRTLSTTFDLGVPLIHGFMLLTMTPALAAQKGFHKYKSLGVIRDEDIVAGRVPITKAEQLRISAFEGLQWHKTPWPQAVIHMMRTFIAKDGHLVRGAYLEANRTTIREMGTYGANISFSSLRETVGEQGIGFLSDFEYLSIGGREIQTGFKGWNVASATRRAEVTFNSFLDMARIEYWKALRPLVKDEAELVELAAIVNKVTGTLDPVRGGFSNHQRQIESTYLMFAPMLRRATAALVWKAAEGATLSPAAISGLSAPARFGGAKVTLGLERRQALMSIGSLVTVATALGAMIYFSGNNKKVFDSGSADFMTAKIGGVRVGIGTPYYALMRMGTDIFNQLKDEPGEFKKWSIEDHAVLKWLRSSMSPLGSLIVDVVNGRTFIGDPLRDAADGSWEKLKLLRYGGRQGMPFWAETLMYDFQGWNKLGTFSELMGLRTSPMPLSHQVSQLRLHYLLTDTDDPDLVKWRTDQINSGQPVTIDEAPVILVESIDERHDDIVSLHEQMETSKFFMGDQEKVRFKEFLDITETSRKDHYDRLMGHSIAFEQGDIDHREFRRLIGESNAWLRGMHEANGEAYKDIIAGLDDRRMKRLEVGEGYIGDILYDEYRATVTAADNLQDEFGNFIPENFTAAQEAFKERVSAEMWDYIQERASANKDLPRLVAELEQARQDLKPFWEMAIRVFGEGTDPHELIESYYNIKTVEGRKRFMLLNPQTRTYLRMVDMRKDAWRLTNPALSLQLEKFYGYSPIQQKILSGRSRLS